MADKSAGEASIKIIPDAKNFIRDLENDLRRRKAEFAVNVTADTTRAALDIDRLRKEQERNAINLKVRVDTVSAGREVQRAGSNLADVFSKAFGGLGSPGVLGLGVGLLPGLSAGLADVTAAIQTLAQTGLALPGIMAAIGADMGTVKIATSGVEDAFKALDKASDGTEKSIKAANEALAKLAPSARDFVTSVQGIKPAFDVLQQDIQGKFFEGLGASIRNLANADLPILKEGLGGIATALNENLRQVGASLSSPGSQGLLDRILGNTGNAQSRLTAAIDPLVQGLGHLAAAGTDVLPRLADDIARVSEKFANLITAADDSGALDKWINDGITGFEHLGSTVGNLAQSIFAITSNVQGDLLASLDTATAKLKDFLTSPQGQKDIQEFLSEGNRQLQLFGQTLTNLAPTFKTAFTGAVEGSHELLVGLQGITSAMKTIQDNVPGFSNSLQQMLNPLKAFTDAFSQLTAASPADVAAQKLRDAQNNARANQNPAAPGLFPTGRPIPGSNIARVPAGPTITAPSSNNPFALPVVPGRAGGGILDGYSPGVDNMLVPLSGGEGIITPDRVREIGPDAINGLNSGGIGGLLSGLFGGGRGAEKSDPAQWLGNFGAKTLLSFGTTLYQGGLDFFGLGNSILSPSNTYFQAAAKSAGFYLGDDGPFGGSTSGSTKGPTEKQLREGAQKITRADQKVAEIQQRIAELKPDAKQSQRDALSNQLANAKQDAQDARTDMATLQSGGSSSSSYSGSSYSGSYGSGAVPSGTGAERWRPVVRQALATYGPQYGITNIQAWEDAMVRQIATESGGNPNAYNGNDPNGRGGRQSVQGIGQFLRSTFDANNITGGNYTDPRAQIAAMIPYVANRYGMNSTGGPNAIGQGHGYAKGGIVRRGFAAGGIVPPRPPITDIIPLQPRPAPRPAPASAPRPSVPAPPSLPAPVSVAPPAPEDEPQPTFTGGAYSATPVSSVGSHTLPAISTGITSGFATAGNLASAALSGGGGLGIPGAGQAVSGLFQQAGKIANDVADVGSALLVGNVPGSFGDPNLPAYGQTLRPVQNVPITAPSRGNQYTFNGISDIAALTQTLDLRDAQDQQASMAHRRPR